MKRLIGLAVLYIIFSSRTGAQTSNTVVHDCNVFAATHSTDTVYLKVEYQAFYRSADFTTLQQLSQNKQLLINDYVDESGEIENCSAIDFFTANCSEKFSGTIKLNLVQIAKSLTPGSVIYISCTVYPEYKIGARPFILINDIKPHPFNKQ